MILHKEKWSNIFIVGHYIIMSSLSLQAQEVTFKNISVDDGLPANIVYGMLEDRNGFMWFGTIQGLARYDGHEFKIYQHDPADPTSLRDNRVYRLAADPDGSIWVGTGRGLSRFDTRTESFSSYSHDPNDIRSLSNDDIDGLFIDKDGRLLIGTIDGFNVFNRDDNDFERFTTDRGTHPISDNQIVGIVQDSLGTIWVATAHGGINSFDPVTGQFQSNDLVGDLSITNVFLDSRDEIWLGTQNGLVIFNPTKKSYRRPDLRGDTGEQQGLRAKGIGESTDGKIWFASESNGLQVFDRGSGDIGTYLHDSKDPESLPSNIIQNIYTTKDGSLWVGGYGGISRVLVGKQKFRAFTPENGIEGKLPKGNIRQIAWQDEFLWMASEAGMVKYDPRKEEFRIFDRTSNQSTAMSNDYLWYVHPLSSANFLLANDGGLSHYSTDLGVQKHFSTQDGSGLSDNNVRAISNGRGSELLVGTRTAGLFIFNKDTDTFKQQPYQSKHGEGLASKEVRTILKESEDIYWIGTHGGGLSRFDLSSEKFEKVASEGSSSIPELDIVWALCQSEENSLWIGTDAGLARVTLDHPWNPDTVDYKVFLDPNIAASQSPLNAIVEDLHGYLWLGYLGGQLARFDPKTGAYQFITDREMSKVGSFTSGALDVDTGRLFFAGFNGMVTFLPEEIPFEEEPSLLRFTEFEIFDSKNPDGEGAFKKLFIDQADPIILSHNQNDFSIGFVGLNYDNPRSVHYNYKLSPYDLNWRGTTGQRKATYTALKPGKYQFTLSASNKAGERIGETIELELKLNPPWWESIWAYGIYAIFLASLVGAVTSAQKRRTLQQERERSQEKALKQAEELKGAYENLDKAHTALSLEKLKTEEQAELLRELDLAKSRFFANVSHEFRTPLSLIIGPLEDLLVDEKFSANGEQGSKLDLAVRNARRVLDLINEILDLSKLESGELILRAAPGELAGFIKRICASYRPLAERNKIDFDVDLPIFASDLYFDQSQLERVFTNLLSNAFKFTPQGGRIRISLEIQDEADGFVEISIRDSGPGIASNQLEHVFDRFYQVESSNKHQHAGTGIGLSLVKELVELHGGQVGIQSELGFGSTFTVRLKLGRSHLEEAQIINVPNSNDAIGDLDLAERDVLQMMQSRQQIELGELSYDDERRVVLLVEDNLEVRSYIKDHFKENYRVLEANNGREGFEMAKQHLPDLIISDVMMDELDGLELCRLIKSTEMTDFIPVILLTARAGNDDKIDGLALAADDYLTKPFNGRELLARSENLIQTRKLLLNKAKSPMKKFEIAIPELESRDNKFIEELKQTLEDNLADEEFRIESLAEKLGMDRSNLFRKVKEHLGESPQSLLWRLRLERAAGMLHAGAGSVSEVAYGCGFKSVAHFSRRFKEKYESTPSEYLNKS